MEDRATLRGPGGTLRSGKTTLLESILWITGAIQRKGSVPAKNTVGDASPEARARQMSVEMNCGHDEYLDESFTFLDCPGSIEFLQETLNVLPGVDAAIVVCEPDADKAAMLQPYLKRLADLAIPHVLFVNKIDKATRLAARAPRHPAGGFAQAAGAAPDSDLEKRHRHRLCRSRARARLCLSRARRLRARRHERRGQGARERSALPDAGKARRLRRASDGRAALRRRAAARRSLRRICSAICSKG